MKQPNWDLIAYLLIWALTVTSLFVWMITP